MKFLVEADSYCFTLLWELSFDNSCKKHKTWKEMTGICNSEQKEGIRSWCNSHCSGIKGGVEIFDVDSQLKHQSIRKLKHWLHLLPFSPLILKQQKARNSRGLPRRKTPADLTQAQTAADLGMKSSRGRGSKQM